MLLFYTIARIQWQLFGYISHGNMEHIHICACLTLVMHALRSEPARTLRFDELTQVKKQKMEEKK